jgi:uncharacterized protein
MPPHRLGSSMRRVLLAGLVAIAGAAAAAERPLPTSSVYVPVRDGVRLALDLYSPSGPVRRRGTVLLATRYGRSGEPAPDAIEALLASDLNVASLDVRGTGASFGARRSEFSPEEVEDVRDVVAWIAKQPWSTADVAMTGNSYAADLADLTVAARPPALKAALIRHSELDVYRHLAYPGGIQNAFMLETWGDYVNELDLGLPCLSSASECPKLEHLRPVDADAGYLQVRQALKDRALNFHPYRDALHLAYADDALPAGLPFSAMSAFTRLEALRAARTPAQVWASWLDAGTADTALLRFLSLPETPMEVFLAPWTHGGRHTVDPFVDGPQRDLMPRTQQIAIQTAFLKQALAGGPIPQRIVHYWPMGGDGWRESRQWPPQHLRPQRFYMAANRKLDGAAGESGADRYAVDFSASTGTRNRWYTQIVGDDQPIGDRATADSKLLTYDGPVLRQDMELTGHPVVKLRVAVDRPDAAIFVYLEAVSPTGRVVYLTEGQLRLIHRKVQPANPHWPSALGPYRTFSRADAAAMPVGEYQDFELPMLAVASRLPKGWRLRLAIAGADADTFQRYPSSGDVTFQVAFGGAEHSYIDVPLAAWSPVR